MRAPDREDRISFCKRLAENQFREDPKFRPAGTRIEAAGYSLQGEPIFNVCRKNHWRSVSEASF